MRNSTVLRCAICKNGQLLTVNCDFLSSIEPSSSFNTFDDILSRSLFYFALLGSCHFNLIVWQTTVLVIEIFVLIYPFEEAQLENKKFNFINTLVLVETAVKLQIVSTFTIFSVAFETVTECK